MINQTSNEFRISIGRGGRLSVWFGYGSILFRLFQIHPLKAFFILKVSFFRFPSLSVFWTRSASVCDIKLSATSYPLSSMLLVPACQFLIDRRSTWFASV